MAGDCDRPDYRVGNRFVECGFNHKSKNSSFYCYTGNHGSGPRTYLYHYKRLPDLEPAERDRDHRKRVYRTVSCSGDYYGSGFPFVYILSEHTKAGRYIFALGSNPEAAYLSGIKVKFYQGLTFVLSGLFASVSGIILLSRLSSGQPNGGIGYEFQAITAAVLGGTSTSGGKGRILGGLVRCAFYLGHEQWNDASCCELLLSADASGDHSYRCNSF